ncbi:MAG: exodeoxyribonuclease VII large subunit [Bacteroidetes bacterium]|nr:exodeoxyribonuclease VII large subunit [bacterium]NBP63243.1 exodeoxyribonuclease VII large subunit [Bacteroidota bacterium]
MDGSLSVSEITMQIRSMLEQGIGSVIVVGEISNFKQHGSGHRYFSLKDEYAQISAVMWKGKPLQFPLTDGMKVIAKGNITVYPPQGRYQLDCQSIVPLGTGDLYMAFEELKKSLAAKGLFDVQRKSDLPEFPLTIGIATSATGAAVQDMLSTLKRRNPLAHIILRPTIVQGDTAPKDIINAIKELESSESEVIIIARGGGSMEDLWAFNNEGVAYAIAECTKPIVSGVGHETDITIADFVADMRAATPTAAAELVSPITIDDLYHHLDIKREAMSKSTQYLLSTMKDDLRRLDQHSGFRRLSEHIRNAAQKRDDLELRLHQSLARNLQICQKNLQSLEIQCMALHPYSPLKKGFALIKRDQQVLSSEDAILIGEQLTLIREHGETSIRVE